MIYPDGAFVALWCSGNEVLPEKAGPLAHGLMF